MNTGKSSLITTGLQYVSKDEIEQVIKETCTKLKVDSLYPKIKWSMEPVAKKATWLGCATWTTNTLIFSSNYWALMKPSQRLDTIRHEVCHLACRQLFGVSYRGKRVMPHGAEWRSLCVIAGCTPRAREQEGIPGSENLPGRRNTRNHTCFCKCGDFKVSAVVYNRVIKGSKYSCKKCKTVLSLTRLAPVIAVVDVVIAPVMPVNTIKMTLKAKPMSKTDLYFMSTGAVVFAYFGLMTYPYLRLHGGWVPVSSPNDTPLTNSTLIAMADSFSVALES